jgi:hypothetical protein
MTAVLAQPKDTVDAVLWERLVGRIVEDHGLGREAAEATMEQGLAFMLRCATATEPQSPTEVEDIGWHTFILFTRAYAAWCERFAGRFIHHEPVDQGCIDDGGSKCSQKCMG